ncbi:uncharacterized protein K452DRAFT_332137 [Aplosporella prunicola CBS 121167]|uniref:Uncharacterized protein n=1 Tax=Aplosporella prunicola CBS 121167 TaxID=1176127 RepID=A0A6A6BFU2_9PEZI|nr:uncharacterized protein K452DRAFT_332137 [Aplosporella prunicola CBS 121167]KAF2142428.1 hypothetical protein K452DRAFT_332137 [Aplosporella prunicola CBS 121167]
MSSTVRLGSLRLSHPKNQLHIESTTYVTTRSSQDSSESDLRANSSAQLTSGSAWLWRQLGLEATLPILPSQHEPDPGGASDIIIKLAHSSYNDSPQTQLPHSLSAKDVKPPDGVHVIGLEVVRFLIHVSSTKQQSLKRKRGVEELGFDQSYDHNGDYSGLGRIIAAKGEEADVLMLHGLEDPCLLGEAGRLFTGLANPSCVDLPVRWPSFSPSKFHNVEPLPTDDRIGNQRAEQHEQDACDIGRLLELIDAVLRLTICDKRSKIPQLVSGLQIHQDDFSTKLSTAAPSIWSPGYLKAVSAQAVFLPTIAHALSTSLLSNARSETLKQKIEKLIKQDIHVNNSGQKSMKPIPKAAYKTVSVGLWTILQQQLFDPTSTKHLKALNSKGTDFEVMEKNEDGMLESECTFEDEDMLYWQATPQSEFSDDTLLWEHEDEEFDNEGDDDLELLHEFDHPKKGFASLIFNTTKVEPDSRSDSILSSCMDTEEEENQPTNTTFRLDDNSTNLPLEEGMWLGGLGGLGKSQTQNNECLVADADILFNIDT